VVDVVCEGAGVAANRSAPSNLLPTCDPRVDAVDAPACREALDKAGMRVDDVDLVEINEAFASVPMRRRDRCGTGVTR